MRFSIHVRIICGRLAKYMYESMSRTTFPHVRFQKQNPMIFEIIDSHAFMA